MAASHDRNGLFVLMVFSLSAVPAASLAQPQFHFEALPELPGEASEVFEVADLKGLLSESFWIVGRALDGDGIWKAVAWSKTPGQPWGIETLPNPFGITVSAARRIVDVRPYMPMRAGGFAHSLDGIPQPVTWTRDEEGLWAVEVPPLPPGYDSGAVLSVEGVSGVINHAVCSGWVGQSDGPEPQQAALWKKDLESGLWAVQLLPDHGSGLSSEATCIAHDNIFEDDVHIGGAVGTDSNPMVPCVWDEQPGGDFERVELPMVPGAYLGQVSNCCDEREDCRWYLGKGSCVGHNASIAGLADLYRGMLYRRNGGLWNDPLPLPPLPGMRDSRSNSITIRPGPNATWCLGQSYFELSEGTERATLWEVALDDSITTYDLNDLTVNLPPGMTLASDAGADMADVFFFAGTHIDAETPAARHGHVLILLSGEDCNANGMDDYIDLYSGTSPDTNGNGIPDECEPGNIVWDPATNPGPWPNNNPEATTRSLRFMVTAPQTATATTGQYAIKVTMIDLQHPIPFNELYYPPANFTTFDTRVNGVCSGGKRNGHHCDSNAECWGIGASCSPMFGCTAEGEMNGCARWVGKPGTFYESQGPPITGPYRAARLQCTPFYWDWSTETALAPIIVVGAEIVPSSEYGVQTYASTCKGTEDTCPNVSPPVTMYTRRAGDVDALYNPGSTPITNQPNAIDVAQVVNKFKNMVGSPDHYRAQLQPNLPELNASINALDVVAVVNAVKGARPYTFSGPCPCPSMVTCGGTCAGCPGLCVKTCTGGDNDGEPCINSNHCPSGACAAVGTCRDACGRCTP